MAFPGSLAKPMNPENLNGVDDNTQLMHLHEPSLLFNLCPTHGLQAPARAQPPEGGASMGARRHRYAKDLIYTYTGYILIAVNPYKKLACYGAARGSAALTTISIRHRTAPLRLWPSAQAPR